MFQMLKETAVSRGNQQQWAQNETQNVESPCTSEVQGVSEINDIKVWYYIYNDMKVWYYIYKHVVIILSCFKCVSMLHDRRTAPTRKAGDFYGSRTPLNE